MTEIYSIGHSNHPSAKFFGLLRQHQIEVVVDVRSYPYSRFAPHFNREPLREALSASGIRYLFLGDALGGRPNGDEFYDADGHVLYGRVAEASWFKDGIVRLRDGAARYRVAIMCSEENPTDCHRRLLVGRVLANDAIVVRHIRGDGQLLEEAALSTAELDAPTLFGEAEENRPTAWRSTQSVLRRSRQLTSSTG